MVVIVWYLYLQLPVQSVPITIKVVSSNPAHGKVCSIQHYVIKSDSDLRQMVVSSTNKTYHHDINEILLKVAFNVITPNPTPLQINVLETSEKVYRRFLNNFSIMLNYLVSSTALAIWGFKSSPSTQKKYNSYVHILQFENKQRSNSSYFLYS